MTSAPGLSLTFFAILLIGAVVLGFGVMFVLGMIALVRGTASATEKNHRPAGSVLPWLGLGFAGASLLLMLGMFVVGWMWVRTASYSETVTLQGPVSSPSPMLIIHPPVDAAATDDDLPVSALLCMNTTDEAPDHEATALPEWVHASTERAGIIKQFVIKSGLFSSVLEAQEDGEHKVIEFVQADWRQYPPRFGELRINERELIIPANVIKAEHHETVLTDFGGFQSPMHRMWYQVEVSPATRELLLMPRTQERASARQLMVLTSVGVFAGLCLLVQFAGFCHRRLSRGLGIVTDLTCTGMALGGCAAAAVLLNQYVVLW
jgi:hypothetical protein